MASGGGSGQQQEGVNLARLNLEQLSMLRDQVEKDTERLSDHFQQLQAAVRRFAQAGRAVKSLAEKEEGTDTLVPLTGSLYVNGKLGSTDKVLIDIGTGYYLEVRANGGRAAARAMRPSRRAATRPRSVVEGAPPRGRQAAGSARRGAT